MDKFYEKKYQDMETRLYRLYDEIEGVENSIEEVKNRLLNIRQQKISEENVYQLAIKSKAELRHPVGDRIGCISPVPRHTECPEQINGLPQRRSTLTAPSEQVFSHTPQGKSFFCDEVTLIKSGVHSASDFSLLVRAKPCFPKFRFSLIRKTELWKTNKPPAVRVVEVASAYSIKPPVL